MNSETDYLKSIAEEIAADKHNFYKDPHMADHHLINESDRLAMAVTHKLASLENVVLRDALYFNTLSQLVGICDLLYEAAGSVDPNVMVLMELLTSVKRVLPGEIRPGLKLPKAFVALQREGLINAWTQHSRLMEQKNIANKLADIAAIPFRRFIEPNVSLHWGDFTWLKVYQSKLAVMDWENTDCDSPEEVLLSLLIGLEFNDDRFYSYCKKYITRRVGQVAGKRKRLLELAMCEKLVLEHTQAGAAVFDPQANPVSARLLKLIKGEADFADKYEREQPFAKFEFQWNVEMIAFFFKLLHENQCFGKMSLERFAETIAANCSSVGKEDFSPATIHSRFYMKELPVIKAIETLLMDMLEVVRRYLR